MWKVREREERSVEGLKDLRMVSKKRQGGNANYLKQTEKVEQMDRGS
jgi:hypothetical protein